MTVPDCTWDTFGRKPGFTPDHPWLFETFDQVVYHPVNREDFDLAVKQFKAGVYEIRIEQTEFDIDLYHAMMEEVSSEVAAYRAIQLECNARESER